MYICGDGRDCATDSPAQADVHGTGQEVPPGPPAPAGRLEPVSGPKSGRHPHKSDAAAGRFGVERTLRAIPTYFHFFRIKSIFTLDVNNHNG